MLLTNKYASSSAESGTPHFALLDALRGVAILGVVCFHLHGVLTHDGKTALFGPVLDWLCGQGELGVEVFFVLSGFVIAHALRPVRICPSGGRKVHVPAFRPAGAGILGRVVRHVSR